MVVETNENKTNENESNFNAKDEEYLKTLLLAKDYHVRMYA